MHLKWCPLVCLLLFKQEPKPKWSLQPDSTTPFSRPETNSLVIDSEEDTLIAGCGDNKVYVWDISSGDRKHVLEGHIDFVHSVSLLRKDKQIVSASEDGLVKFWDPRCDTRGSTACVGQIEPNQLEMAQRTSVGGWVSCLDISPSEDWMVSGLLAICLFV